MPDLCPMLNRSPGVHVSHVIHDLCVKLNHYTPSDPEEQGADRYTRFGLGSALEHAIIERYSRTYPARYYQIGECERDKLFGTPDLFDANETAVHEMKLTWSSSRHEPDSQKFVRYWWQLKAYCAMLNCTRGVLHVCFVNGDYKGDRSPIYRVWECEWTKEEIEMNWHGLLQHANELRGGAS
jgi:hypothetical protein